MINEIAENRKTFKRLFDCIIVTGEKGKMLSLDKAFEKTIKMVLDQAKAGGKLLFIGNGGSASIASHMSADFLKNARIPALAFNDPALLTCISNDLGYERVFKEPIEMLALPQDILMAVSSSGQSGNILLGVKAARAKGAKVITFSGFNKNNPLRKSGRINFYVPSADYGQVEVMHLYICHCLVDVIIKTKIR